MSGAEAELRTLRFVTGLLCMISLAAGFFLVQPDVALALDRLAQDRGSLQSDAVVLATQGFVERERERLERRHRSLSRLGATADLLRKLGAISRKRSVRVLAIDGAATPLGTAQDRATEELVRTHLRVELRGNYRSLLATIDDLSAACDAVFVEAPSLHWDGTALGASVPLVVVQPRERPRRVRP